MCCTCPAPSQQAFLGYNDTRPVKSPSKFLTPHCDLRTLTYSQGGYVILVVHKTCCVFGILCILYVYLTVF